MGWLLGKWTAIRMAAWLVWRFVAGLLRIDRWEWRTAGKVAVELSGLLGPLAVLLLAAVLVSGWGAFGWALGGILAAVAGIVVASVIVEIPGW